MIWIEIFLVALVVMVFTAWYAPKENPNRNTIVVVRGVLGLVVLCCLIIIPVSIIGFIWSL